MYNLQLIGSWYNNDYISEISGFERAKRSLKNIKSIIVPHAGYKYSGNTANLAYSLVDWDNVNNIIILCTDHSNSGEYILPKFKKIILNKRTFNVNEKMINNLIFSGLFFYEDKNKFEKEHSFEVQLPFIDYYSRNNTLITPILIGSNKNIKSVSDIIIKNLTDNTLIITTTDLSHYGNRFGDTDIINDELVKLIGKKDRKFINSIINHDINRFNKYKKTVCGFKSVELMMNISLTLKLKVSKVKYSTSYELSKSNDIVTYASLIYTNNNTDNTTRFNNYRKILEEKNNFVDIFELTEGNLTDIPRCALIILDIYNLFDRDTNKMIEKINDLIINKNERKFNPRGIFVTHNYDGELNGCIGTFYSDNNTDLIKIIIKYTLITIFDDNRFYKNPLRDKTNYFELTSLKHEFKVNYLENSFKIIKKDFFDKYIPGLHGIILHYMNRDVTYLPSVMIEQGWIGNSKNIFKSKRHQEANKYLFKNIFNSLIKKMGINIKWTDNLIFDNEDFQISLYSCHEYSDIKNYTISQIFVNTEILKK